jgi:hypothetical protein
MIGVTPLPVLLASVTFLTASVKFGADQTTS